VADVPELPGCMSQGKTVDQALKNVKEAISLYLEASV
jgi:predicted RNase H-like HicB family nuclease